MEQNCCRTCLSVNSLNPIFQWSTKRSKYTYILQLATGLKIEMDDQLSQLMCTNCVNFVNQYILFREKCRQAYISLKNILKQRINAENIKMMTSADISKENTDKPKDYIVFETQVKYILKKPVIVFENLKVYKKVALDYSRERGSVREKEDHQREIECGYCPKVFKSKVSLNNHSKIHTTRRVICEHCGKQFLNKHRLLMHCRSRHGYEKTDKCQYCDYKGSNAELVKIHERTHTGERPFVCVECGVAFHRRSSHLQHLATHLPHRTVQCDECPALFKSVTLMRIHKSRHRKRRRT